MLPSFVMPEIVLGVAMFMVVSFVLKFIPLGTWARSWAGDYQLSYPVIIVRARMLSIGKEYEEAAMDLFASSAIAFADSLDFVTVRYLSCSASSEPLSVKIYNFHGSPTPAVNAAASSSWSRPQWLVTTTVAIVLGYFLYGARQGANGRRAPSSSRTSDRTYAVAAPSRSVCMGAPVSIKTRSASGGRWTETGWPCA
jgi:spermidine/putrescine transport system permease protein